MDPHATEIPRATEGKPALSPLNEVTIVLDCRWLRMGGAGRITELLLADYAEAPPPGKWLLWGDPDALMPRMFRGAEVVAAPGDPRARFGQAALFSVPRGDVVVYLHQVRPLRPGRSVTFILDTIPLRHGGSRAVRVLKRAFFVAAARMSTRIVTISDYSRACIMRDLAVAPDQIDVVSLPVDVDRARRVAALRRELGQDDLILYVGRFDRHKNLERLCLAFRSTNFAANGGILRLVGGWGSEVGRLQTWVEANRIKRVVVTGQCSEEELDLFYAKARALVSPSLDEGYGLPAFEAAASGLPVAVSRTGAMSLIPPSRAVFLNPLDVADITRAVDEVVRRAVVGPLPLVEPDLGRVVLAAAAKAFGTRIR